MKLRTDRFSILLKRSGLTQTELAKKLGVDASQVSRYKNGYDNPSSEKLEKLAKIFDTSIDYLLGFNEKNSNDALNIKQLISQMRLIPVLGRISAGHGALIPEEEEIIDYISIPQNKNANFGLIVSGDSMTPDFVEGDVAIVLKQDHLENGQIGVIKINGDEAVIKKFYRDENEIQLISINPEYPAKVFRGREMKHVHIIGRVVGKQSWI